MKRFWQSINGLFFSLVLVFLCAVFPGCLSARAGAWHQGPDDLYPQTHEIGFDSADWVQRDRAAGRIEL